MDADIDAKREGEVGEVSCLLNLFSGYLLPRTEMKRVQVVPVRDIIELLLPCVGDP